MNNFLDLHSDIDYRNINRPYYTGTWEYIAVEDDQLIPFQFVSSGSDAIEIVAIDTDGNETEIGFYANPPFSLTWTKTGGGSWSSTGAQINAGTANTGGYQTSSTFTLTANQGYRFAVDLSKYTSTPFTFELEKGGVPVWSEIQSSWDGTIYFTVDTTGSDYTIVITNTTGTEGDVTNNIPALQASHIAHSGDYWSYDGERLITSFFSGVFYLKVTCGADVFYSDWCDICGFAGKMKYKLSSAYDYGGVKYDEGYEQWIYKDASVRRSPRSEIEITANQKNGIRIDEKIVSAVRYITKMKVTESEYEAFVHSISGTIQITDYTGKFYSCVGVEMSDPEWHRGNGILEISFTDENNISTWTRNNTSL